MGKMNELAIEVDNEINRVGEAERSWKEWTYHYEKQINSYKRLVARLEKEKHDIQGEVFKWGNKHDILLGKYNELHKHFNAMLQLPPPLLNDTTFS